MKNKFCVSKTLTYLVLLVAVVIGAFYTMNVVNTQKLGANPEAAAAACKENGVKGVYTKSNCANLAASMRTPFHAYTAGDSKSSKCCIPDGASAPTCTANKITSKSAGNACQYETGKVSGGRCLLGYTSGNACTPAVGSSLNVAAAAGSGLTATELIAKCKTVAGQCASVIPNYGGSGKDSYYHFTGTYYSTTRVNPQAIRGGAFSDFRDYCATDNGSYNSNGCI